MPQRPSRVIRSSEQKAARGKTRTSLRGEIDDIRSDLTKTEEEARRKQAFYDAVKFYRNVLFTAPGGSTIVDVEGKINANSIVLSGGLLTELLTVNGSVSLSAIATTSLLNELDIVTGSYTPTLTNVANVAASTASLCYYARVSNIVIVFGNVTIDPTLGAATTTQLGMSLPIASALTTGDQLRGVVAQGTLNLGGDIFADSTNDRANFFFASPTTSNFIYSFMFGYVIL